MATWRRVSALLILLGLLATACTSEPAEVVAGGDDTADALSVEDLAEAEGATERTAVDADSTDGAVANDSAPVVLTEDVAAQLADLETARALWESSAIEDFDVQIDFAAAGTSDDERLSFENVDGRLVRVLSDDTEGEEDASVVEILFDQIEATLVDIGGESVVFDVEYDERFGYPALIKGSERGEDFTLTVDTFRLHDEYPPGCSAATAEAPPLPNGLTPLQAETFERLVEAIVACDYLVLDHISYSQDEPVLTSFGGTSVEHLWQREAEGEPLMATLVDLLGGEPAFSLEALATWPAEFADPETDYLGWRTGISKEGEWLFFIAGD